MPDRSEIKRYRANWQGEVDAASTYRTLAELERDTPLAGVYQRMAEIEERHVEFWEQKLAAAGAPVQSRRPTTRARIMRWIARRMGSQTLLPTLSATEQTASHGYDNQADAVAAGLHTDEQSHARLLRTMAQPASGMEGGALARFEGRHRAVGGNALRAAVLGANDGLCSTLSLVMGVAGAGQERHTILIAGIAGVLAGACAMAMGEWLSVQSARELAQRQIATEADELKETPREEQEELALIYQAKGLNRDDAERVAAQLIADPEKALDTLAREELGIDPEELGGSAWEAGITSFLLFVAGAIAPLTPFFFPLAQQPAVIVSLVCSALALFAIGAAITLLTGRSVLYSGARQLVIGMAAAGVTYGIGKLVGVAIG